MRPFQPGIAAKLNKPVRVPIGVLTLWPIIYVVIFMFVFFIGFFIPSIALTSSNRLPQTSLPQIFPFSLFGVFFALQFFTIFLTYGLMVLYIVDVFRNDYITSDRKALWAAMPTYWYLYFWREKSKDLPPFSTPYGQYLPYAQYPPPQIPPQPPLQPASSPDQ